MKKIIPILVFFLTHLLFEPGHAQDSSKYKEFKHMKLNFILNNSDLTSEEEGQFHCIFNAYNDKYHNQVWHKQRAMKISIKNSLDSFSAESASKFINKFHAVEKLGVTLIHNRNQKLLEKIRPKEVLNILYQEKRFDHKMFNKIRKHSKKKTKKK